MLCQFLKAGSMGRSSGQGSPHWRQGTCAVNARGVGRSQQHPMDPDLDLASEVAIQRNENDGGGNAP